MIELFERKFRNKKYLSKQDFSSNYITDYDIRKLLELGYIERIKNGVYVNKVFEGNYNELYSMGILMRKGVVCLLSAAYYHKLINEKPEEISIAINLKRKRAVLPERPKFNYFMFDVKRLETGVVEIKDEIGYFRIYDKEKTICDLIFYRNKLGIDKMSEALNNYLQMEDINLNKLITYSKQLRCFNQLSTYLSVLL